MHFNDKYLSIYLSINQRTHITFNKSDALDCAIQSYQQRMRLNKHDSLQHMNFFLCLTNY